jgi:Ni/Co efflux regulator RcnB
MQTARLLLFLTLVSFGAAFAQSPASDKATQTQQKTAVESDKDRKKGKEADKATKKQDKEKAKSSAKKADNAQNQVNAQAYKTTVPKP